MSIMGRNREEALSSEPSGGASGASSRHRGGRCLLFLLLTGSLVLTAAPAALGQGGYTGVTPPRPVGDPYVGPYVGPYLGPQGLPIAAERAGEFSGPGPQGSAGGAISVENAAGDASSPAQGDDGLLTRSDLVTSGALGLGALIAFVLATGRFRSR
jgi:hypothetical protein